MKPKKKPINIVISTKQQPISKDRETVAQFLKRGGKIQKVRRGVSGYKA